MPEGLSREGWSQAARRMAACQYTLTAWLECVLAYGGGTYRGQMKAYAEAAGMERMSAE